MKYMFGGKSAFRMIPFLLFYLFLLLMLWLWCLDKLPLMNLFVI